MIRAVLLDLDGTLVDAFGAWGEAFGDALDVGRARVPALDALGPGPRAHLEVFRPLLHRAHVEAGGGEWQRAFLLRAFVLLLEQLRAPDPALAADMLATYEAAWPRYARIYPEVPALLDSLAGRYRLGIVSNGLGAEQRLKIEPLGLDRYVEAIAIAISGELGVRKPEPAIFRHVLGALDVVPGEAVHVGDDLGADVGGARAAGLAAGVWVNRVGMLRRHIAPHARADFELADLTGLEALLRELDADR